MQHVPGEEARAEGSADPDEHGHTDPHRIRSWQQQPGNRTDEQPHEEEDDQLGDKSHGWHLPAEVALIRPELQYPDIHESPPRDRLTGAGRPSPSRSAWEGAVKASSPIDERHVRRVAPAKRRVTPV